MRLRLRVGPIALGNALGSSVAGAAVPAPAGGYSGSLRPKGNSSDWWNKDYSFSDIPSLEKSPQSTLAYDDGAGSLQGTLRRALGAQTGHYDGAFGDGVGQNVDPDLVPVKGLLPESLTRPPLPTDEVPPVSSAPPDRLPSSPPAGNGLRLPTWLGLIGKLGVGLELATFTATPPTTNWKAAGSKFSYSEDDFTLRVFDGDSGVRISIPGIHNPSQYSDAQYLSYVSYKANGGQLAIDDYVSFDPPSMGPVDRANSQKPEWLQRLDAGNAFNKERSVAYPYNEVYVNKPSGDGYFRVDSYNDRTREIVSRKFTQFSEITDRTGIDYVNEMAAKYPSGATIANVPTNVRNGLAGEVLVGRHILEVPVQIKPIPQAVIDAANRLDVLIRDTKGKTY